MNKASSTPSNSIAFPKGVSTIRGSPSTLVGWPPIRSSRSKIQVSSSAATSSGRAVNPAQTERNARRGGKLRKLSTSQDTPPRRYAPRHNRTMHRILIAVLLTAAALGAATVTHDIEFIRRGDAPLRLDASVPDGPGPFPTVIIVHGGGFTRG